LIDADVQLFRPLRLVKLDIIDVLFKTILLYFKKNIYLHRVLKDLRNFALIYQVSVLPYALTFDVFIFVYLSELFFKMV